MNTTVKSLQDVYVGLGGSLTDTYENIANGVPVSDYVTIPDVIEALSQIAGSTLELPAVSAADNGDALEVVNGKWAKVATTKLPTTTEADTGSVLMVNEDGEWDKAEAPKELPDVTASDNGSILGVVDGAWAKGLKIKSGEAKVTVPSEGTNYNLDFELWKGYGDAIEKKILIGCTLIYTDVSNLPQNVLAGYTPYAKTSTGQNSQNVRVSGLTASIAFTNGHEYTLKYYYIEL